MIAILGAGPHGRELADVVFECREGVWFYDDDPDMPDIRGPVTEAAFPYLIGAAWPMARREIHYQVASKMAAGPFVHPDATISRGGVAGAAQLAPGVVVAAGARIGVGVSLGGHTHVNLNATVSRGSEIGSFVTVAPGAHIAGGVIVEDDVFVGIGAVISHELVIGHGALIGAGAVVVEDVKPGARMVGNPARPLPQRALDGLVAAGRWHT